MMSDSETLTQSQVRLHPRRGRGIKVTREYVDLGNVQVRLVHVKRAVYDQLIRRQGLEMLRNFS